MNDRKSLKFPTNPPITGNGMVPIPRIRLFRILCLSVFMAGIGSAEAAKKKAKASIPLVAPASKQADSVPAAPAPSPAEPEPGVPGNSFQELNFNRTLVIEGKVEKPAVQFTLLKEPPPEKEIRFETSFLQNILKLDRENTFKAGETYGRE